MTPHFFSLLPEWVTIVDNTIYLLFLPLATIKKIRKAVKVLQSAGVSREMAIDILLQQHREKYQHLYR
jgi:hypothetical protein